MQAAALDILIVDDLDVFRMLLTEALTAAGCTRIREAASASDAQAALAAQPADLLLIDKSMPGGDGIELITQLRADVRHAHAAMILLTGVAEPPVIAAARAAGADAVLEKPLQLETLLATIETALATRAA